LPKLKPSSSARGNYLFVNFFFSNILRLWIIWFFVFVEATLRSPNSSVFYSLVGLLTFLPRLKGFISLLDLPRATTGPPRLSP